MRGNTTAVQARSRAAPGGAHKSFDLGELIRDARESQNLTQEKLAEKIGTTAPYVTQIESGRRVPTAGKCLAISDALPESIRADDLANHALRLRDPEASGRLEFRLKAPGKPQGPSLLAVLEASFRRLPPKDQEALLDGWRQQVKAMNKKRGRTSEKDKE